MTTALKIENVTVHVIGEKPTHMRKVIPALKRVAFIAFLGSVFWATPQVLDAGLVVYSDIKTPPVDAPLSHASAVWLSNDEPIEWEEAAKDVFYQDFGETEEFSYGMLHALFENLKITDEQSLMVAVTLKVASEHYILGSDEPVLKSYLETRNTNARIWLDNAWEQIQQQSLTGKPAHLTVNEDVENYLDHHKTSLQAWMSQSKAIKRYSIDSMFAQERTSIYANTIQRNNITDQIAQRELKIPSYQEAQNDLLKAVEESGLGALIVPGSVASSARLMYVQSLSLQQANKDLQKTTGFDGGVLGLNRRVVLHNEYSDSNGSMHVLDNGYIWIKSEWNTLGHEWFHGLDATQVRSIKGRAYNHLVSRYLDRSSLSGFQDQYKLQEKQKRLNSAVEQYTLPETESLNFSREIAGRRLSEFEGGPLMMWALDQASQEAVANGAVKTGSSWWHYRMRAVEIAKNYPFNKWSEKNQRDPKDIQSEHDWRQERERAERYLLVPSEKLAFVFQGHLEALYNNGDIKTLRGELVGQPGIYIPTVVESRHQIPLWNTYFTSLNQWWMHDQKIRMDTTQVKVLKDKVKDKRTRASNSSMAVALKSI